VGPVLVRRVGPRPVQVEELPCEQVLTSYPRHRAGCGRLTVKGCVRADLCYDLCTSYPLTIWSRGRGGTAASGRRATGSVLWPDFCFACPLAAWAALGPARSGLRSDDPDALSGPKRAATGPMRGRSRSTERDAYGLVAQWSEFARRSLGKFGSGSQRKPGIVLAPCSLPGPIAAEVELLVSVAAN
jgi:hypothetical protein